jgi:hypothetical protein
MTVNFTVNIPGIADNHQGRKRIAEVLAGIAPKRISRFGRPVKICC